MQQTITIKSTGHTVAPAMLAKCKRVFNLLTSQRAALGKKFPETLAHVKANADICNDFHLNQAVEPPTQAVGIFYALGYRIDTSSVPCGALMRPLPDSRWKSTGSGTFLVSPHSKHIVSF